MAICQDRRAIGGSWRAWGRPGLHAIATYRLTRWRQSLDPPGRQLLRPVTTLLSWLTSTLYQIHLSPSAEIGPRFVAGHQSGIVIGRQVRIGADCRVEQNVTLGGTGRGGAPALGDRVWIGPGAVIMGDVVVGHGARIEAHAIVVDDVEPGGVVGPPPSVTRGPRGHR